ncbi:chalcone isomerase family protein [Pseudomonas qingdaonensis]|uniref:chalcone isomerase family protein n=1 Tax=Pseudomonas qingdaonensis TaxID=2056231 RepID=UPI001F277C96|nr:chalcone isomerase family protein [Pseudomonas qingdaonensis]
MRPPPIALCRLLLLIGVLACGYAQAGWRADLPDAVLVGSAEFRTWGLDIYTARLWAPGARLNESDGFALEITYRRAVSRERLVEVSLEEIQRLSATPLTAGQRDQWQAQMQQAFVDVEAGMRITGVYVPGLGCRFYVGERLQHEVRDQAFARAFFAIWLDPRSRYPDLRRQLLGASP